MKAIVKGFLLSALLAASLTAEAAAIYDEQTTVIQLKQNPEFIIKLKSNPTTGYHWALKNYDEHFIKKENHHFEAPASSLVGAPGYEVWVFKAEARDFNSSEIKLAYERPWEKNKPASEIVFKVSRH